MKKIKIGDSFYEIQYNQEAADLLINMLIKFMEEKSHYASHSGEAFMQDDFCQVDAPELVSDMIDNVLKPKFSHED